MIVSCFLGFTREQARSFGKRRTRSGVKLFAIDVVVLVALSYGAVTCHAWWQQLLFAEALGFYLGVFFVLAHDAAHNALTSSRKLNRVLAQLAMIAQMHPYTTWCMVHHKGHHRWTQYAPVDYVYAPLDPLRYSELPWYKRALYRFYRSAFGPLLYYLIDVWWKHVIRPPKDEVGESRSKYRKDLVLVLLWCASYLTFLAWGAQHGWFGSAEKPIWNVWLFGALVPFLAWNVQISITVYLHHTHPSIKWYDDLEEWKQVSQSTTSVHVVMPAFVTRLTHSIMEHTAHHLRPGIPLYNLQEAQAAVEESEPSAVTVVNYSIASHLDTIRRCKLFDFQTGRWQDFKGNYTS